MVVTPRNKMWLLENIYNKVPNSNSSKTCTSLAMSINLGVNYPRPNEWMYRFTYRYIFLRRHSAFLSQYACIVQQRWRFWASLYSQSKSDAWRNLNFRYKGKLELSVLLPWLPWLVKRDELRLASGIFLMYLYCASKAERKLRKKLLAANTKKKHS